MHPRPRAARPTLPRRVPDLFSPHPLDPTRRHPHRRRRRSPPFARRHGYCTAIVLCVAAMSAQCGSAVSTCKSIPAVP